MPTYNIRWKIDLDAESKEQAARMAEDFQRTEGARCFEVAEYDNEDDSYELVDLDELDREE